MTVKKNNSILCKAIPLILTAFFAAFWLLTLLDKIGIFFWDKEVTATDYYTDALYSYRYIFSDKMVTPFICCYVLIVLATLFITKILMKKDTTFVWLFFIYFAAFFAFIVYAFKPHNLWDNQTTIFGSMYGETAIFGWLDYAFIISLVFTIFEAFVKKTNVGKPTMIVASVLSLISLLITTETKLIDYFDMGISEGWYEYYYNFLSVHLASCNNDGVFLIYCYIKAITAVIGITYVLYIFSQYIDLYFEEPDTEKSQ